MESSRANFFLKEGSSNCKKVCFVHNGSGNPHPSPSSSKQHKHYKHYKNKEKNSQLHHWRWLKNKLIPSMKITKI